jgi:hypothetical protein
MYRVEKAGKYNSMELALATAHSVALRENRPARIYYGQRVVFTTKDPTQFKRFKANYFYRLPSGKRVKLTHHRGGAASFKAKGEQAIHVTILFNMAGREYCTVYGETLVAR